MVPSMTYELSKRFCANIMTAVAFHFSTTIARVLLEPWNITPRGVKLRLYAEKSYKWMETVERVRSLGSLIVEFVTTTGSIMTKRRVRSSPIGVIP